AVVMPTATARSWRVRNIWARTGPTGAFSGVRDAAFMRSRLPGPTPDDLTGDDDARGSFAGRPVGRNRGGTPERLVGFPLGRSRPLGHDDLDHRVEIATIPVGAWQPPSAEAQTPPARRPRRHLELHRPIGRVDPD